MRRRQRQSRGFESPGPQHLRQARLVRSLGDRETGSRDTDETGRAKYRKDTVKVEKWYYNRGYGDFIYTLTFEGDTLKAIEKAGRGR